MKNFKDCDKTAEKPDAVRPKRDDDPNWLIVKWLADWVSKRGTSLPQPCPTDFLACANWWRNNMQPKRLKDDQVLLASSLLKFLDLSAADKMFVVGGIQDGVPYNGESMKLYRMVYNETMATRDMNRADYVKHVRTVCRDAVAKMARRQLWTGLKK